MKTSIIATFVGFMASTAMAANCEGSHEAAWGTSTWDSINTVIANVCNSEPYNSGTKYVEDVAGYNVAAAEADVGTGGSPNCWAAMYQIRDQCLDTGNGHYATQGWWQYGDEYYFLWAWDQADCRGDLSGYSNPGC